MLTEHELILAIYMINKVRVCGYLLTELVNIDEIIGWYVSNDGYQSWR